MSPEPLVSVIIPTYNRAKLLPTAIQSVLDQTYKNVEVLVIDDGSTDETTEVLKPLTDNIIYLTSEHKGTAHARNIGMKAAIGKYIAFCDSDDKYLPFKLELQVSFMEKNPEVGMVFTEFSGAYKGGRIDKWHMHNYHEVYDRKGWNYDDLYEMKGQFFCNGMNNPITYYIGNIFKYTLIDSCVPSNTILFPKKIIETVGYQNEKYRFAQEYEFVVRICKSFRVAFLNTPTYVLFHHKNQATDVFYRKIEKLNSRQNVLDVIEGCQAFYDVVVNLGYEDKVFYQKNRKDIDSRLGVIYCERGELWLKHGDIEKSKEYFQKSILFAPGVIRYRIYLFLTHMPRFIRPFTMLIMYKITKWYFLLRKKGLIGFIKNITRFYQKEN